jgi:vacuolar-type H+-ATPase subunit H
MVRKARREAHDIVMAAKQQADDFVSDARLEAEYMVRKLTARATDEIREAVANISNSLLPEIDQPFEVETESPNPKKSPRGKAKSKR